jgi:hypothetical protein
MERNEGRGRRPGTPKNQENIDTKEQGGAHREGVANNPLFSRVVRLKEYQRRKSGEKAVESIRQDVQELSNKYKIHLTPTRKILETPK